MNTLKQTELFSQLLERRFQNSYSNSSKSKNTIPVSNDFYVDMLCVFHNPETFKAEDFNKYPISIILLYLRKTHEFYLNKNLGEILLAIEGLSRQNPSLSNVQSLLRRFFKSFAVHLEGHIQEEEVHLFPYIDALLDAEGKQQFNFNISQKMKLIDFLLYHDNSLEEDLSNLVNGLKDQSSNLNDSFSFQMLVNRLTVFELDLRIHGKIEDEVLIPLAFELEKKVLNTCYGDKN